MGFFIFFIFFAACSYLPGNYICWRRVQEELPPDLLLFPCEVFSSENPIVSELGWDLGLVLKGLSLGNEINKEYILVFQALWCGNLLRRTEKKGWFAKLLCCSCRPLNTALMGRPRLEADSLVLPRTLYHSLNCLIPSHTSRQNAFDKGMGRGMSVFCLQFKHP